MYCTHCSAEMPENAAFCMACGSPAQGGASAPTAAPSAAPVASPVPALPSATGQIVFSVINMVCLGGSILGIVALVFSILATTVKTAAEAEQHLKVARILNIIGISLAAVVVFLCLIWVLFVVLLIPVFALAGTDAMEFDQEVDVGRSQIGNIEGHLVALLCYLLGWIPGLVFFVGESENRFIRFHALQSLLLTAANFGLTLVLSIPITVVSLLTCGIGSVLYVVPSTLALVFRIIALIKGVQKQYYRIPLIGDLAERWSELPVPPSAPPPAPPSAPPTAPPSAQG